MFMLVPHPLSAVQRLKRSLVIPLDEWRLLLPTQLTGLPSEALRDIGVCSHLLCSEDHAVFVLCFPRGLTPRPIRRSLITDPKSKADTMGIGSWALRMV